MYNKIQIDRLFKNYIATGDDKVFGQLIEVCDPMISIVLARYGKHSRHFSDMRQEVKMKLWEHLRKPVRGKKYLLAPSVYLFFVVRAYVRIAYEKLKAQYGESFESSFSNYGDRLLSLLQSDLLDPERLYIVRKEIPRELFKACKRGILTDGRLVGKLRKTKEAIRLVKEEIEGDFDVELKDEL